MNYIAGKCIIIKRLKPKPTPIIIILAILTLFALPALLSFFPRVGGVVPGDLAPAITGQLVNNERLALADLQGKTVVLNFWATWCGPCRAEMPLLDAVHNLTADVVVIGVNASEPPAVIREFQEEIGVSFPLMLDPDGRIGAAFGIRGYPTTIFIDPSGIVYAVHQGVLTPDQMQARLAGS